MPRRDRAPTRVGPTPVEFAPPATRHVAAGGWRRAIVGTTVGAAAGLALLRVMPPDHGGGVRAAFARLTRGS